MDLITRLLFEDPLLLVPAGAIALAVTVAVHRVRFTTRTRRAVWITLSVCVLLLVVQKLCVTPREALMDMIRELARAVDAGDIPAIANRLDDTFQDELGGKAEFILWTRMALQHGQVDEAGVSGFEVELLEPGRARAFFWATCDWRSGSQSGQGLRSAWKVECARREDGWKLTRITRGEVVTPWGTIDFRRAREF